MLHIYLHYHRTNLLDYTKVFRFCLKAFATYDKLSLLEHLDCATPQSSQLHLPYRGWKQHTFKMTYFLQRRFCGNQQLTVKIGFLEVKSMCTYPLEWRYFMLFIKWKGIYDIIFLSNFTVSYFLDYLLVSICNQKTWNAYQVPDHRIHSRKTISNLSLHQMFFLPSKHKLILQIRLVALWR